MKLLIMQFSPVSYYFIPLGSKYPPQHPVLRPPCLSVDMNASSPHVLNPFS
jgi:hypothetical protein